MPLCASPAALCLSFLLEAEPESIAFTLAAPPAPSRPIVAHAHSVFATWDAPRTALVQINGDLAQVISAAGPRCTSTVRRRRILNNSPYQLHTSIIRRTRPVSLVAEDMKEHRHGKTWSSSASNFPPTCRCIAISCRLFLASCNVTGPPAAAAAPFRAVAAGAPAAADAPPPEQRKPFFTTGGWAAGGAAAGVCAAAGFGAAGAGCATGAGALARCTNVYTSLSNMSPCARSCKGGQEQAHRMRLRAPLALL